MMVDGGHETLLYYLITRSILQLSLSTDVQKKGKHFEVFVKKKNLKIAPINPRIFVLKS